MAFLMKRCIKNFRNIKTCRKLCVLSQCDKHNSHFGKMEQSQPPISRNQIGRNCIHTSYVDCKTVAFKLSDIGEGIREVLVKEWFVKVGDRVQQFDNICEVQSDKAAVRITSRYDGIVTRLYQEVDTIALVGQPLIDIEVDDEGSSSNSDKEAVSNESPKLEQSSDSRGKLLTTPSVRRIAAQFKVDLSKVKSSGKNGRLLKEDLLNHLHITAEDSNEIRDSSTVQAMPIPVIKAQTMTEIQTLLEDKVVPLVGFTRAMVKSMTESMKIPHFLFCDEYDVTKLVATRDILKKLAEEKGVKLTYMPIIIKAVSLSLAAHPILNSSLDSTCENIIYKAGHNIGVAMDTPNGLVVPVIKNVQSKSILGIAKDLNNIQDKGGKGQLGVNDLSGGTFTISNIGVVGGTYAKPMILPPQVSIGALGKIQALPRFDSAGNVVKANILTVSWCADHRVIDGVTMARFSNHLKKYLENPNIFLLDL